MKKLSLVTCLYDLVKRGSPEHRTVDWMLANADFVLNLDRELVIFTDSEHAAVLRDRRGDRPTTIVTVPLEELLRSEHAALSERGARQHNARAAKVTPAYIRLMWAKYAMLERALDVTDASHVGWIDLAITHVAKAPPDGINVFGDPPDAPRVHVLRVFSKRDVDAPYYWRYVQGHLAGGLVVGSRDRMRELVGDFWTALERAASMGLAPLDEGLLSYVVGQKPSAFSYSYGDYEDILRNHDEVRGGDAHLRWIVEDAKGRGLPVAMGSSTSSWIDGARSAGDGTLPLLGLCMIVKNESSRIVEVLASYQPYVDRWTILDTGSTDGTQDLIRRELAAIPGMLYEEPFVDFATSRNRALELHGSSTVFSIMPNGDVLEGGIALRDFLGARRNDSSCAYRVRISPGHYYHPLVMRCGMGWHYKGRTHECATGPGLGSKIPGVTVLRDRGKRTDEEWRSRWRRDLDLLERDREEEPANPRAYFYLGQTHECLGQYEQALRFFEQRAKMGGYFDEVYEAKFRVGKMMEKIDRPWAEAQQAYLDAHAHDPRRAEPLYAIAERWYDEEQHPIARIFATAAADLPKPPTDLFLDEEIYQWRAADIAAISSFYAGYKEDGRYFADQAVRARPNDERLRANRAFYAERASEMFGAQPCAIDFVPEPGWNASNPSIYRHADQIRCVVRTVNYRIVGGAYVTPEGDGVIRTRNFLLDFSASLHTTRAVEMVDKTGGDRSNYPIHGFEDARLFVRRGKWCATATVCDFTAEGRREIALLEIDEGGSIVSADPLRGPWSVHAQKNWMPVVDGDAVKFVYATHPTTIFELIDAPDLARNVIKCPSSIQGHGRLRGGSQGVRFDDGWIFIVHDVAFPGDGRIYLHRFVFFDEDLQLVSMTDPFYFEHLGIEFCAGLAHIGENLVASYAVNDGTARLGIFNSKGVQRKLRKDFAI